MSGYCDKIDIVHFDRGLISSQLLLARAQDIFIAPERLDISDDLRGERLDAFRYLSTLLREHTEENEGESSTHSEVWRYGAVA